MLPNPPDSPRDATPETYGASSSFAAPRNPRPAMRRVSSGELFGAATELVIIHGQREYRLRVTSNGKLILTA
jgi:hemin uptake protein HemP